MDDDKIETAIQAEGAARRAAFIASLRAMADFFEQHPNVRHPRYNTLNVFVDTREELAKMAKGVSWKKVFNSNWFFLSHVFGEDLELQINTNREMVCRKVVVGKTIVPAQPEREVEDVRWECDMASLLGDE